MVYKQKKTFTLIEMLIVVVIIGILAAALIPRLQSVQARARDTKRKADLHQIATALAIYKEDAGNYKDLHANRRCEDSYVITDTKHITNEYRTPTGYQPSALQYINTLLGRYMTSIPTDPTMDSPWISNSDCFDPNNSSNNIPIHGYLLGVLPRHYFGNDDSKFTFDSIVLGARTESDGSSSNRVTDTHRSSNNITGYNGVRQGIVGGWEVGGAMGRFGFNAQTYDDYICSKVTLTGGDTTNDGNGNCEANKDSDALRYIYVQ